MYISEITPVDASLGLRNMKSTYERTGNNPRKCSQKIEEKVLLYPVSVVVSTLFLPQGPLDRQISLTAAEGIKKSLNISQGLGRTHLKSCHKTDNKD